jgi:hypothetical protein
MLPLLEDKLQTRDGAGALLPADPVTIQFGEQF